MPTKTYPFERGGADRITVTWKSFWKDVTVEFDGSIIGTFQGQKEIQEGRAFTLPDGSTLEIKLVRTWSSTQLQVLRDGKPLPGSGSDPITKLKQSYGILYLIGGLNFVLGILALLFRFDILLEMGMGIYSLIVGGIYLLLGFLVQRRSKIALGIAIGLYGIETILALISGVVSGVVVRVFIIVFMWPGFQAIDQLKRDDPAGS